MLCIIQDLNCMKMSNALVCMSGGSVGDMRATVVAKATCSQLASVNHANHGKASVKECHDVCRSMVVTDNLQHA